jgi:hypothetical protein
MKKALTSMNFHVTVINDEYPQTIVGKIMGKLHIPLLLPWTRSVITTKYLTEKKYDVILIIKGRGMSAALIDDFKRICPKVIGYTFDSFKYHSAPLKWHKHATKFCTFDYVDAQAYSLPVVELFSSVSQSKKSEEHKYEISAILRNHSERLKYVDRIFNVLNPRKHFIYIYEKNLITLFLNFVKNPILYQKYKRVIHFRPLEYKNYVDILSKSNFTIDFAHPKQSGITIRCFEAASTQTKVITNNAFVLKNEYFNDKNTIIFSNIDDSGTLKKCYKELYDLPIEAYHRTIHEFLSDLLM